MKKIKDCLVFFAGFSGQYCEIELNECDSAPCLNGAVCQNDVNRYDCFCPEGKLFKIIYFYFLWQFLKLPSVCKISSWQSKTFFFFFNFLSLKMLFFNEVSFAFLSIKAPNKTSTLKMNGGRYVLHLSNKTSWFYQKLNKWRKT